MPTEKGFCSMPIEKLVKAGWNYKENNEELSIKLANNIKRNGQIENIIIRELDTGFFEVVNGNHRLDVLQSIGYHEIQCYNLGVISESHAKRIAIETNETKFTSNDDLLSTIMKELVVDFGMDELIETMPFSDVDMELFNIENLESPESGEEDNFEPEEPADTEMNETNLGDIYELNGHRLICGDSTNKDTVELLFNGEKANQIATDPPYGVSYSDKNEMLNKLDGSNRSEREIVNDGISNYREFFTKFLSVVPLAEKNTIYVFISGKELHNLRLAFDDAGLHFSQYLVWLKNNHALSRLDYMCKDETIAYGWKDKHEFYGASNSTSILEYARPQKSELHPTMKPVALIARIIHDGSKAGEIIYDSFCGSGTTLIAAEQMNRRCYCIEFEPFYCDVIVKRWVRYMKENNLEYVVKLNGEDISNEEWINV